MKRRLAYVSLALVVLVGLLLASTQVLVPRDTRVGMPSDGAVSTILVRNSVTNIGSGRGIISAELPIRIDGQLVWIRFPAVIGPTTWIRADGAVPYLPARLVPTSDSSTSWFAGYLTNGDEDDALKLLVRRDKERLDILKVDPVSLGEAESAAPRLSSLPPVDFSEPVELRGVVDGIGRGELDEGVTSMDLNVLAELEGMPVWVLIQVIVPDSAAIILDGTLVDLQKVQEAGFKRDDVLDKVLGNEATFGLKVVGDDVTATSLEITSEMYWGPSPGDTGGLEEAIGGF